MTMISFVVVALASVTVAVVSTLTDSIVGHFADGNCGIGIVYPFVSISAARFLGTTEVLMIDDTARPEPTTTTLFRASFIAE